MQEVSALKCPSCSESTTKPKAQVWNLQARARWQALSSTLNSKNCPDSWINLAETCLPNNLLKLSRYVVQKNIARKDLEVIREIGEFGENIVVSSKGDNVEILAVLSPDEWKQWNKLGQRYLYAQLSLYIQRIWPQIEDDFKASFLEDIQRERKYLFPVSKQPRWQYQFISNLKWRLINDDSINWWQNILLLISKKFWDKWLEWVKEWAFFSRTGDMGSHDNACPRFELSDLENWFNLLEKIVLYLFCLLYKKSIEIEKSIDIQSFKKSFKKFLKPLLRIIMKWSLSRLPIDTENLSVLFEFREVKWSKREACFYPIWINPEDKKTPQNINDKVVGKQKQIKEDNAVWCPALFTPGMVEYLIDLYLEQLFHLTQEANNWDTLSPS